MHDPRRKLSPGESGVNLAVIITPFLDMAFQLLAFFIMTYSPSALEAQVNVSLVPPPPNPRGGAKLKIDVDAESVADPDLAETTIVTIKAVAKGQTEGTRHDGEPSRILLKRTEDAAPTTVADSNVPLDVGLKSLEMRLKENARGSVRTNIRIEGEGDLKHQYLMRVYDVCKGAGFANVSFVAPEPARRNP